MDNGKLVKFEQIPSSSTLDMVTPEATESLRRLLCNPGGMERLIQVVNSGAIDRLMQLTDRLPALEGQCRTLANRCDATDMMFGQFVCPANVNYSQRTLDEYSDDNQINLDKITTGLGGDYLNAFPLTPSKLLRLTHLARPGYTPTKIAIDLNIAGGGNNYLDFILQFFLVPGGTPSNLGLPIGPEMRGNQFLNKDGTQIHVPFPEYRNAPLDIGSLETLALVIRNSGAANNLDSAFITVYYDNKAFYAACKKKCGC